MPRIPPSVLECRWCTALATGIVSAHGKGLSPVKVPHCDAHWEEAYRVVRSYPERTWKIVDKPDVLF